ncbi:MAG: multidrug effflux MFS transporter [Alphaproteobacteria bacterium]|nr:multidrug effflux MFS transporter [Alphaproteobacteria bacterium]
MSSPGGSAVSPLIPALLIAASSASVLSTDLYAPSLPHLPALLSTDASTVTLTMSLNLGSFALAQLFHGPLADRFGRRPVFLGGMAAFLLTALAAASAQTIEQLIVARVLMGIAASVEAVIALAVIRDLYDEAGAVRILAIYGMTIAIAPAVGPVIGGFVFVWAGWRANFLLLAAAVALVFALSARWLPETVAEFDRHALGLRRIAGGYLSLLANRNYMAYSLTLAFGLAGIFAFVTSGPFVFIARHGVATQYYGFFQMAIVAAFFVGTMVAGRAVGRIDARRICGIGVFLSLTGGAALIIAVAVAESPWSITAAVSLFAAGLGPLFAAGPVLAMGAAPQIGGGVSAAMIGTLEMGGGALGALIVGLNPDAGAWPLAATMAASSLLILLAFIAARGTESRARPS